MSKYAWLFLLVACKGLNSDAPVQGSQEAKSGITTSALSIFAGTVQAGWDKDSYSWNASATVSSGTLKVSESAGGWFALAHLASNGQIANITLAPYAALSFDISAIPAGLTCQLQSGSGQNANTSGQPGAVALSGITTSAGPGGMLHIRIPMTALKGSLSSAFEIGFSNGSSNAVSYSLNNVIFEVAAGPPANPAQPTPPAGALSVYADGIASGWADWSWPNLATQQTAVAMGTTAMKLVFGAGDNGLKMENLGSAIAATTYSAAHFYVNPSAPLSGLQASLENTSNPVALATLPANTWTHVCVPMSALNSANQPIQQLELLGVQNVTFYVDAIWLDSSNCGATIPAPKITSLTASLPSMTSGQTSTLSWTATNATSYTVNGVPVNGTQVNESPTTTTLYVLAASGPGGTASASTTITVTPGAYCGSSDKIDMWKGATKLRGANIMYEWNGGNVWPSYTQADFNLLASWGANYVELSVGGIYTQTGAFVVDEGSAAELKRVLDLAYAAKLWAVIAFRTGPGRSEDTFNNGGNPLSPVWSNGTAQTAWTAMWKETATRFKNHPAVAG